MFALEVLWLLGGTLRSSGEEPIGGVAVGVLPMALLAAAASVGCLVKYAESDHVVR